MIQDSDYRYGPQGDWEPWYKNKDCHNCKHFTSYASDGFIYCGFDKEHIQYTLPFVQFHPTDCDKFEVKI